MSIDQFPLYKIATRPDWDQAVIAGLYRGSSDDLRDGFIHFSTRDQLQGTARKHFAGKPDLVLIAVDPAPLAKDLRWEPSRGGQLFPHLYAPLPTDAAIWIRDLHLRPDEVPDIDAALATIED